LKEKISTEKAEGPPPSSSQILFGGDD